MARRCTEHPVLAVLTESQSAFSCFRMHTASIVICGQAKGRGAQCAACTASLLTLSLGTSEALAALCHICAQSLAVLHARLCAANSSTAPYLDQCWRLGEALDLQQQQQGEPKRLRQ